jgi:hypothetical protein
MAIERDLELLDDYLANRLTGGEKEAFEQRIESDPTLKSEYQLQQKLVEGIRNARVAELKTMLNNTPVPSLPTGQGMLTKIAAWTVVSGIIATGIYFLLDKDQKEVVKNENKAIVENNVTEDSQKTTIQPSTAPAVEEKISAEKPVVDVEKTAKKKTKKSTVDSASKKSANAVAQRPNIFDPTAETETDANSKPEQQAPVETKVEETEIKTSTIELEIIDTDKKHTFHYQFKNDKLFLYGSLERNLYEILEFFSGNKRTMFLYYKDNYYLLNEDNNKIKQLVPINDPALLNKLKEFRSKSK